jgi:hypothetical protein
MDTRMRRDTGNSKNALKSRKGSNSETAAKKNILLIRIKHEKKLNFVS